MHRWILLIAVIGAFAVAAVACGDDPPGAQPEAAPTPTPTPTGTNPPVVDAGPDARRTGCLDRPTELARPDGRLPCELIPPGLTL
jgi:hypothetical protein